MGRDGAGRGGRDVVPTTKCKRKQLLLKNADSSYILASMSSKSMR